MSLGNLDPELRPVLQAYLDNRPEPSPHAMQEIRRAMREMFDAAPPPRPETVVVKDLMVPGPPDQPDVALRIYLPAGASAPLPALYWMHGGGMTIGSVDMDDALLVGMVEQTGMAAVSVEYRLAPEHPDPAPVEDCYAGLAWTVAHAGEHGIDPGRIAVGGASAGGGLAAGTALMARDRNGPAIAFQLLLEPMLDDRAITHSSTQYQGSIVWDRNDNLTGWTALLGERVGTDAVSEYAAPARAADLSGLPPALLDVGEIETFRDECIEYAQRLLRAGVSTELHVYPGAFHGFDLMAPDTTAARAAWRLRWSALTRALCDPGPETR